MPTVIATAATTMSTLLGVFWEATGKTSSGEPNLVREKGYAGVVAWLILLCFNTGPVWVVSSVGRAADS